MKNESSYLSKINNDPLSSLYLVEVNSEKVKENADSLVEV
jgi:hypothetical protein